MLGEVVQTQSVPLFFTIALFFAAIVGLGLSVRHRISLVYSYCLLMGLFQAVDSLTIAVGSTVVLFLILEVFNPDERLVSLFSFRYKIWDFTYRMACELYGLAYYILVVLQAILPSYVVTSTPFRIVVLLGTVALAAATVRGRFSTKSITEMLNLLLEAGGDPACFEYDDLGKDKLKILLYLEDRQFMNRDEHEHTVTVRYALSRLRRRLGRGVSSFTPENARQLVRGYGTIEMQLLRNIGLKFGSFGLTCRRKLFEWVFAHTLFNSYINQLAPESFARKNIKYWILRCYLNIVSVKIGSSICRPQKGLSTFRQLFGKEFAELSREEFFVWCLGLPHYVRGVGRNAVAMHGDLVGLFCLDVRQVYRALDVVRESVRRGSERLLHEERTEGRQAERVSAWFEEGPDRGRPQSNNFVWQYVVLRNASESPVYNVVVTCVGLQGAGPLPKGEDNRGAYPCRCFVAALPPGLWGVWLPTYGQGMSVVLAPEVAFRDAHGVSWVRRGNGTLERITSDPVTFYGVGLPCPWGSCERVAHAAADEPCRSEDFR